MELITHQKTLLFVDNNSLLALSATRNISRAMPDWRSLLAGSCEEARKAAGLFMPDAAVLDVGLPDGDGLELMSELRDVNPALPVIMISQRVSEELRHKVYDRGGYALIKKPFAMTSLIDNLRFAVARAEPRHSTDKAGPVTALMIRERVRALVRLPEPGQLACYGYCSFDVYLEGLVGKI